MDTLAGPTDRTSRTVQDHGSTAGASSPLTLSQAVLLAVCAGPIAAALVQR